MNEDSELSQEIDREMELEIAREAARRATWDATRGPVWLRSGRYHPTPYDIGQEAAMRNPYRFLEPALKLPAETRAELAVGLLESLGLSIDGELRDSEIAQRLRELKSEDADRT